MLDATRSNLINRKSALLRSLQDGTMTIPELAAYRVIKKISWCDTHLDSLLSKYAGMLPEDQAFHIIYFDHLSLNPNDVVCGKIAPRKLRIESRNFCPYLEACNALGLETRIVCSETGESPFQVIATRVHPNLKFSRDYQNIRPHTEYCEEFLEFIG
jgi:hypothetical protein